jgi:fatty-acyl-CoA synthase
MIEHKTFIDAIARLEEIPAERGFTFIQPDGGERFVAFRDLAREVRWRGRQLLAGGLARGDRLALIIPQPDEFVLTFLGAVSVGVLPVPLYPPLALGRLDTYLESTARVLETADCRALVTTAQVEKVLWALHAKVPSLRELTTVEKVAAREPAEGGVLEPGDVTPADPVFLQFTSGSTAAPKGVVVTQGSLVANGRAIIGDGLGIDLSRDKGVSWLPLYHDMGLIGFVLAPVLVGIPVVFIPTLQFVKRPTLWMDVIHRHRGTMTFAPNFAFARVTKRSTDADLARWDLSCLKVVGCGAEPIHAGTMRAFVDKMAPAGLKPESLLPCYGMAEATLAMTFVGLDERLRIDAIDADACYEEGRAAPANGGQRLELVSCGRPFPGHEIGVFGDDGRRLGEREIGEIRFRGPSVAGGYFRNPEATRAAFGADGWLRTGDLGYLAGGELYISGRKKDILIIHGRNYYPQAIEWLAEDVEGVRKGNVVAFSVPGADTEEVVIVAETTATPEARPAIATKVRIHLNQALSLAVADVVLIGVGELPKTSSGKVQRRKTREQYLARTLGTEGVRTLGGTAARLSLARHVLFGFAARLTHRAQNLWPWWPMTMMRRPAPRAEKD